MVIQYFLVGLFALALIATWRRAGVGAISRGQALLWSLLWIGAAAIVLRPEVTDALAWFFGVGRGVDVVIYFSVISLFYLVFRIFLRLDKIDRDITRLVREIGLNRRNEDE